MRHLRTFAGSFAVAATLWLLLAAPGFIAPDRVSPATVAARGAR